MNYQLQPLRIPAGWTVSYNDGLYEVDPDPDVVVDADRYIYFDEDLLALRHQQSNRILDVGWYPSGNLENGGYGLFVFEQDWHGRKLHEYRTRDRHQLVTEIERLLLEISEGRL